MFNTEAEKQTFAVITATLRCHAAATRDLAALLRVELGRCCAAPPSPSPRRLRQLLSRHRRQGGPSPPPDPPPLPSPALPSPSPPPRKRSGRTTEMLLVKCAHRKMSEVRLLRACSRNVPVVSLAQSPLSRLPCGRRSSASALSRLATAPRFVFVCVCY